MITMEYIIMTERYMTSELDYYVPWLRITNNTFSSIDASILENCD